MKKAKLRDCHRNVEKGLWNQREREPSPHTPSVWYLSPVSRGTQCWEEVPSAASGLLFLWTKQSGSERGICSQPRETLLLPEGPGLEPLWLPPLCSRRCSPLPNQCSHPGCPPRLREGTKPFFLPGEGVGAARQDSFHPGPSPLTLEPLQPPPSRSLSPCAPKPSVHSPHFCQCAISNNAILIMSLSCSKFFSRSPRFSGQKFLPLCMENRLCHALALWSLPIPSPPPLASSPCNFHLAPTEQ